MGSLYDSSEDSALPPSDREFRKSIRDLEVSLQGHEQSDSLYYYIDVLNKMKESDRQRAIASQLVKSPLNYSLIADPVSERVKDDIHQLMLQVAENMPRNLSNLLNEKLLARFGSSYGKFVSVLHSNILLKVLMRWVQEGWGISDKGMAEIDPLWQLMLIAENDNTTEKDLLKVMVREFELGYSTMWSFTVEDIITELVEKMAKGFAEVASAEDAMAVGFNGISLAR
ncbi:hypothetical protein PHJA_001302000 [Phtheirospermum japonicum]|uniref:Uncharacterized protein n=1 Tax=Phtheirospermum japonicum TaxID=374723 RepID=A0A830BVV1_9LAMI|nr:hypothetical protein PHJA_001302000 [Phtheirospermum japonicum]